MLAEQHSPNLVLLDIIDLSDKAKRLTTMSPEELKAYKTGELWTEIKATMEKPTPALLEREFTKLKDAADMHNNLKAIRALGVKVSYYRCDLNNPEAFGSVMQNLKADLGQLDGVVHFAGIERSKLAVDKSIEEYLLIFNKPNSIFITPIRLMCNP